jgi:glutamine amidotransferase
MIAIVDYDVGNLQSVANMLTKIGIRATCTNDAGVIREAAAIILPGNGSFGYCMNNLRQTGLIPVLENRVADGVSLLGICVGAQILGNSSEEGGGAGLGWLDMEVKRFEPSKDLRVPQMGWNYVVAQKHSKLTDGFDPSYRFYFVHSYFLQPKNSEDVLLTTEYGTTFVSGVEHGNIFGVQFHPEKSHRFGKRLLYNFAKVA